MAPRPGNVGKIYSTFVTQVEGQQSLDKLRTGLQEVNAAFKATSAGAKATGDAFQSGLGGLGGWTQELERINRAASRGVFSTGKLDFLEKIAFSARTNTDPSKSQFMQSSLIEAQRIWQRMQFNRPANEPMPAWWQRLSREQKMMGDFSGPAKTAEILGKIRAQQDAARSSELTRDGMPAFRRSLEGMDVKALDRLYNQFSRLDDKVGNSALRLQILKDKLQELDPMMQGRARIAHDPNGRAPATADEISLAGQKFDAVRSSEINAQRLRNFNNGREEMAKRQAATSLDAQRQEAFGAAKSRFDYIARSERGFAGLRDFNEEKEAKEQADAAESLANQKASSISAGQERARQIRRLETKAAARREIARLNEGKAANERFQAIRESEAVARFAPNVGRDTSLITDSTVFQSTNGLLGQTPGDIIERARRNAIDSGTRARRSANAYRDMSDSDLNDKVRSFSAAGRMDDLELVNAERAARRRARDSETRKEMRNQGFSDNEINKRLAGRTTAATGRNSDFRRNRQAWMNVGFGVEDAMVGYEIGGAQMAIRSSMNNVTAIVAQMSNSVAAMSGVIAVSIGMTAVSAFMKMTESIREGRDESKLLKAEFEGMGDKLREDAEFQSGLRKTKTADSASEAIEDMDLQLGASQKLKDYADQRLKQAEFLGSQAKPGLMETGFNAMAGAATDLLIGIGSGFTEDGSDYRRGDDARNKLAEDIETAKRNKPLLEAQVADAKAQYELQKQRRQMLVKRRGELLAQEGYGKGMDERLDAFSESLTDNPRSKEVALAQAKAFREAEMKRLGESGLNARSQKELSEGFDKAMTKLEKSQIPRMGRQFSEDMKRSANEADKIRENIVGGLNPQMNPLFKYADTVKDLNANKSLSPQERTMLRYGAGLNMEKEMLQMQVRGVTPQLQTLEAGTAADRMFRSSFSTNDPQSQAINRIEDLTREGNTLQQAVLDLLDQRLSS